MLHILVATKEEYELARKYLSEYRIIRTGVGAGNVIKSCLGLMAKELCIEVINVGFCGSNYLPIGTVTEVSRSWRLIDENVEFEDFRNGHVLSPKGVPCYTANSFVTESNRIDDCVYDMELNYIVDFPIHVIGAVKIVSDNLCLAEYENSVTKDEATTWEQVRQMVADIAARGITENCVAPTEKQ